MNIPTTQYYLAGDHLHVDSDFLNNRKEHKLDLKHCGFGDFAAETPDGTVAFIRADGFGFNWEGMVGRPHRVTGAGAEWLKQQLLEGPNES